MRSVRTRGMKCQISGRVKYPAGVSLIVRNMSIPVVRPILIQKAPAGRVPIHKMRSCLASKGIAKVARFLNFILLLKLIFIQKFPRKTLIRTKRNNSPFSPQKPIVTPDMRIKPKLGLAGLLNTIRFV